jgi:type IV secretory pathway VirB3-like protein
MSFLPSKLKDAELNRNPLFTGITRPKSGICLKVSVMSGGGAAETGRFASVFRSIQIIAYRWI